MDNFGKEGENRFAYLSDTVKYFAEELFPGYKVRNAAIFRITRNSDLYFDEEETENLLQTIENELHNRRKGAAVRLEIESCVSETALRGARRGHRPRRRVRLQNFRRPLNLARLRGGLRHDRIAPTSNFRPSSRTRPSASRTATNIFAVIRERDRMLHHPYDSFSPVEDFVSAAADDPNALAIKMTLYRTGKGSPVVNSLKRAAANGKQVTVLIELKARFDEENNIQWARELEECGVHVLYGIVGYKTHCKTCLVVRREDDGKLRRYVHLGTGNYNSKTAKCYTDISLFTANAEIAAEVADLFNTLTGKVLDPKFKKLWVAPFCFHSKFLDLVEREISHAKAGGKARIIIKVNSVIEQSSIDALYPRLERGGENRPRRARHMRARAGRKKHERKHLRAQHRGGVPRTQPDILL